MDSGIKGQRPASVLARAAANTRWSDLPEAVRAQARDLIVDTVAVVADGGAAPEIEAWRRAAATFPGRSTVIRFPATVPAPTAALLNGGATTVNQLQDGHRPAGGHPASHVWPAVFALAEERGAAPHDLIAAFVAGYEVAVRTGMSLRGVKQMLHDTGTWGTVGAAAGAAHLLSGGNPATIEEAIEGAAAIALFPYRDTAGQGASIHHLYIGLGSSIGVTTAVAVESGLRSLPSTLENFFGPQAGKAFDAGRLTQGVADDFSGWSRYEILNAYFKVQPTCAHIHCVNDIVEALVKEHLPSSDQVDRVDVWTYKEAMEYTDPHPVNGLAARFSIPYTVAAAIECGDLSHASFADANIRNSQIVRLCDRVQVHHDPKLDSGYPAGRPARVTISLRAGSALTSEAKFPRGDVTNPISRYEKRQKALRLLAPVYGPDQARKVVAAVEGLFAGGELGRLTDALRG